MEDFLDRLNWSYVIVAVGIFMGCLLISLVLLYGQTKDRWDWGKPLRFLRSRNFLIVMLLVVVGGVSYPPLKRMSVVAYERNEAARREAEEAKEMKLRGSERMISLGGVELGMNEEEILLLLGHPSEEESERSGGIEYKYLTYLKTTEHPYKLYSVMLADGVCRQVSMEGDSEPESARGGVGRLYSTSCLTPYEPADRVENETDKSTEPRQIRTYKDNNLKVELIRDKIVIIRVVDFEWLSKDSETD